MNRDLIFKIRDDSKETQNFIDFTNLRIDSFTNVLQLHT